MARSNESYRLGYGATNYNPDSGRGAVSVGRVGNSVRDYSSPGRSFGSGVGATLSLPMKTKSKAKGGKISAAEAVHKHERAKHKGQPLTKMAKGGSASKRADGCATKGKTKGKFV